MSNYLYITLTISKRYKACDYDIILIEGARRRTRI